MTAEIGHFALILALCLAVVQLLAPAVGVWRGRTALMQVGKPAALMQCAFLLLSFICLTLAFIDDDFSVLYVANNGNTQMPLLYKISGVWGAHEGSLLLWVLMLSLWSAAAAIFSRAMPLAMRARVLSVLAAVSIGFLLFTLLTSNPFARLFPPPQEGRELNPLLQDPGLAIHPPMLYMGYVGFSVAFAFSVAALLAGRMDSAWARWLRPWANFAWLFLTLGIALGSWWAYYELGWGGWWFWDPVENASFMPWLAGTAFLHSLAVTEARGSFRAWTALLGMLTFSLCLLGTFIVRSGVLTSVHAFAVDPARGLFILIFLVLVIGGALLLFAWRMPQLRPSSPARPISREGGILLNNVLLSAALFAVLLGTLYPLLLEALGGGKLSVGAPYFNSVFVPLTAPLAAFVGIGAYARWKKDNLSRLWRSLWLAAAVAAVGSVVLLLLFDSYRTDALIGLFLALWTAAASVQLAFDHIRLRGGGWRLPSLSFLGMVTAHFGLAVFVAGVTVVSIYGAETDVRMAKGDVRQFGGYDFSFHSLRNAEVENYQTQIGEIHVRRDGQPVAVLYPEKRRYGSQSQPLTEAAIDAGFWRDIYVSLGEPLADDAWSVRLQIKPLIRWIWGGAVLMALGAFLAALGKRQRQ